MTASEMERGQSPEIEPTEIEALLPWYAAGTLRRRDRRRVANALQSDAAVARQLELVREELAETIHLNETLGAPSPRVAERLMAAIEAESVAARKRNPPGAAAGWLTGFFANLSPRTLAIAASFAVLAIGLQAVMLFDVSTKPPTTSAAPSLSAARQHGAFAMVRFDQQASAAQITDFLQNYQATLVDGPTPGGLYRIRVAMTSLAKEELHRIVQRMRHESIVASAEPSEPPPGE
jgi:anti-sigma-K factor RskA